MIRFDASAAGIAEAALASAAESRALSALSLLENGAGAGGEYTEWFRLPEKGGGLAEIKAEAGRMSGMSEVLVVVGIGGSYLGARALMELLTPEFGPKRVIFAGKDLSARRTAELMKYLGERDFSLNVISKSGGTTEPSASFRLLLGLLEKKYGAAAADRVTATTDPARGALLALARERGWRHFAIPSGVGGRYSVLSPVGLIPAAFAGIDVESMLAGALEEKTRMLSLGSESPELRYASARRLLAEKGFSGELLSCWEPCLRGLGEWYEQLFAESEGKEGRGIFPVSLEMPASLHSIGQFIQQGPKTLMETMLHFKDDGPDLRVPSSGDGMDDDLSGKSLGGIASAIRRAVIRAHCAGGVPVMSVEAEKPCAGEAGALIWFFEAACGVSAYMDGVNPFDQPGVEDYKKIMKELLRNE